MKTPYFLLHQESDTHVAYTLYSRDASRTPTVIIRPSNKRLSQKFVDAYNSPQRRRGKGAKEPLQFPTPSFTTLSALEQGEPKLHTKLSPEVLTKVLMHLAVPKDQHGRLVTNYTNAYAQDPFAKSGTYRVWWRSGKILLPEASQIKKPTYDKASQTLTYFTTQDAPSKTGYSNRARHILGWRHQVKFTPDGWVFSPPEAVPEIDQKALNLPLVDAAFGGQVQKFLYDKGRSYVLLVNFDEPKRAKRFVLLENEKPVGAYDSLGPLFAQYPKVDRQKVVTYLATVSTSIIGRLQSDIITDPQAWVKSLKSRRRIGPPQFTMRGDESRYEPALSAGTIEKMYPGLNELEPPELKGDQLTWYTRKDTKLYRVTVDTRQLSESVTLNVTPLFKDD